MSRNLSPAAQAVLDACNCAIDREMPCLAFDPERIPVTREIAAAALRAVADQVAPEGRLYTETLNEGVFVSTEPFARFRKYLFTIATELEPQS